jgi:hypothetical protein
MNLYDLTHGNYHSRRTLSYPEYPNSQIVFDTEVTAISPKEWSTTIAISGTYDGPTDFVAVKDYQVSWTTDGKTLLEKGRATLERASGDSVRSEWSSSIVPKEPRLEKFPSGGETLNVTFSPLKVAGNKMSYEWQGTVRATPAAQ